MAKSVFFGGLLLLALAALTLTGCSKSTDASTGYNNNNGSGAGSSPGFNSGNLANGASFSYTFTKATTSPVTYYCQYHKSMGMTATFTVASGGTPTNRSVSITGFTLPNLTLNVGDKVTWTNNSGYAHTITCDGI